jgi:hypothetical protein
MSDNANRLEKEKEMAQKKENWHQKRQGKIILQFALFECKSVSMEELNIVHKVYRYREVDLYSI